MLASMRRVAVAVLVVAVLGGTARAAPKRSVRIETEPEGATVYVGDKESGSVGTTPLDLSLPPGEHTLILELDRYLPRFEVITVGKKGKARQVFQFRLESSVAVVIVRGKNLPASARVLIDGTDHGPPPARVEVDPGAHQVQVLADGAPPFETWIEVDGGAQQTVDASVGAPAGAQPPPKPVVTAGPAPPAVVAAAGPASPRPPFFTAGAGYEVGWRRFRYQNALPGKALPFDAEMAGLISLWAELYPHRALDGPRWLRPLSLVVGFGYGLPLKTTLRGGNGEADASWRTADVGLRYRLGLGELVAVDLDVGWGRLLYTFAAADGSAVDETPDVDYQAVRLGGRLVARTGEVEAWIGGVDRQILSAGTLAGRFRTADVAGFGVLAGTEGRWWNRKLSTRLEVAWSRYDWTFTYEPGSQFAADAGTDDLFGITLLVGLSY